MCFICAMAVQADSNITPLDITNAAGNIHFRFHAKLFYEGAGLHRSWPQWAEDAVHLTFGLLLDLYLQPRSLQDQSRAGRRCPGAPGGLWQCVAAEPAAGGAWESLSPPAVPSQTLACAQAYGNHIMDR